MFIVTGGAGFIGSALVWKLNEMGIDDIMIVDHMGTGAKWKNLAKRRFSSLIHKDELEPWLERNAGNHNIEAVFHLGASSSTTETDVDYLVRNNLNYTQMLWQYCADYQTPFIYASSAATYGAGEYGYSDDDSLVPSLVALNPYGFSKQKFDLWALKNKNKPPFWAGIRFFNVYGPQEYHKGGQTSVVYQLMPQLRSTGVARLFKSYRPDVSHGEQRRDFVYVKDCVRVLWHLFENAGTASSGIYNLGTGEARSFADLARAVFSALDMPANFEWIEMPENLRNQYQYFTEANLRKLREQAGYTKPMTTLEEGVRDYVVNYLLSNDPYL